MSVDMQTLQWWTEAFIKAIIRSTRKMPYAMRYLLRETLLSLRVCVRLLEGISLTFTQEAFPDFPPEHHAICVGKLVFYHFINPVLMYSFISFRFGLKTNPFIGHPNRLTWSPRMSMPPPSRRTWHRSRRSSPR